MQSCQIPCVLSVCSTHTHTYTQNYKYLKTKTLQSVRSKFGGCLTSMCQPVMMQHLLAVFNNHRYHTGNERQRREISQAGGVGGGGGGGGCYHLGGRPGIV